MRLTKYTSLFLSVFCVGIFVATGDTVAQGLIKAPINTITKQSRTDSLRLNYLLQQSSRYFDANLDSSLSYARKGVELAQKGRSKRHQAIAFARLGLVLFRRSDFAQSQAAFDHVEQLSRSFPPDSMLLTARIYKAMIARTQGDYPEGLRLALAALKLYEATPAAYGRKASTLFSELGVIYDYLQDSHMAQTFHQRRLLFSEQGGTKREQAIALSNLGYFYLRNKAYEQARQVLSRALSIAYSINNQYILAGSLQSLGQLAFEQKNYSQAIRYYRRSLKTARASGSKEDIGVSFSELARVYEATGNYAQAARYAQEAVRILDGIRSVYHLQQALSVESQVLERMNRFQEALSITRYAHLLADSLAGVEKQKTIAQLQTRYDISRKQQQIATLNKNLLIQRQATRTATLELQLALQERLFFLTVALLLGLLLAVGFASYRRQKRVSVVLHQQKDELVQQAHKMAGLNKTKDKLLSLIGHDLRSPLGHIKYGLTQLHDEAPPASGLQQSLAELDNQTDHVLALLTNLLDWSYLQMKGFQFNKQEIDLYDIIIDIVSQSALHLKQKKIQLINLVARRTMVQTDKYQLACILRNLLSNAIKFSTDEGIIRLHVIPDASGIQLFIRDTGVGMTAEQLRLLRTNPQMHTGTRGEPGTGLGLQLCRELIANLSGTMHITSHPDKGTTVQINLPKDYSPA